MQQHGLVEGIFLPWSHPECWYSPLTPPPSRDSPDSAPFCSVSSSQPSHGDMTPPLFSSSGGSASDLASCVHPQIFSPSQAPRHEHVSKLTRIAHPHPSSLYIMDVSVFPHHSKRADPIRLNYLQSSVNSRQSVPNPVVYGENTTNDRKLQGKIG